MTDCDRVCAEIRATRDGLLSWRVVWLYLTACRKGRRV
jgi:hypothetical protein